MKTASASAAPAVAAKASAPLLLQRRCTCGNRSQGGDCDQCSKRKIQRKGLSLGATDSPLEAEADRIADLVTRGGSAAPQGGAPLQVSRADAGEGSGDAVPAEVDTVLASAGQPLDAAARAELEPRFGHDFSQVRVHADAAAQASARAVDAAAYTVGHHLVFGTGQYRPHSSEGRHLLAHELTHALQQGPAAPSLQRKPAAKPWIKQVVVEQTEPQKVSWTYSDGHTEQSADGKANESKCSTGKGHCCFDATSGASAGGACSAPRSNQVGNNCTPVGDFTVTLKREKGGIPFWTQFHDAKAVALHEYWPVDGTPLSHGCVRLQSKDAELIFRGAVVGVTKVKVQNLAKPRCENTTLQAEWQGDYNTAGSKPLDGSSIDPDTGKGYSKKDIADHNRNRKDERDALKSAFGVDDTGLDKEIDAVNVAKQPLAPRIPRCVPAQTQEEAQTPKAKASGFLQADAEKIALKFSKALTGTGSAAKAEKLVRQTGEALWQKATADARAGGAGSDDRQLYWTRLMLSEALRAWNPSFARNADELRRLQAKLLKVLEDTSRGFTSASFDTTTERKHILVSGFDPFGFTSAGDIRQSNLSGAAALALDGEHISDGSTVAEIQSAVFPVRYADFNEGVVEAYLRPHLDAPKPPNLVMSISQGSRLFELEENAGRNRSTQGFLDNVGVDSGGSPSNPVEPPGLSAGKEFLPQNVPSKALEAMRATQGRKGAIRQEIEAKDLPKGATQERPLDKGPFVTLTPPVDKSVEGAGGGFLSNEIFYRNSLLRSGHKTAANVPTIHLHTPMMKAGVTDAERNRLIEEIRKILRAALAGI